MLPVNAALNWVLIYGHLGAPPLGVAGSGYASAICQWLMLLGLAAAIAVLPRDDPAHRLRPRLAGTLADIRRILTLGLPIGGLQALEIGVFVSSAALMGLFGAEALAAHQIAIMCASFTFMVPMGIGQAATVRVATERGAAAWDAARRAGFVALGARGRVHGRGFARAVDDAGADRRRVCREPATRRTGRSSRGRSTFSRSRPCSRSSTGCRR